MDSVTHVLDTHVVLWAYQDSELLGEMCRRVIERAPAFTLGISGITLLEIAMLVAKGRLHIEMSLAHLLEKVERDYTVLPVDAATAALSFEISLPHGDPFDRTIVATAISRKLTLMTKDRAITHAGVVPVVW